MDIRQFFAVLVVLVLPQIAFGAQLVVNQSEACAPASDSLYFSAVSSAISSAQNDDTILVCPGTYTENIAINKKINLLGVGPASSVVIASAQQNTHVIAITSNDVNITNITAKGAKNGVSSGIYAKNVKNIFVSNVETWGNISYAGVYFYGTNSSSVVSSKLHGSSQGILLWGTSQDNIANNEIYENGRGIYLPYSDRTSISQNTIHTNDFGIAFFSSRNISIIDNKIYSSRFVGVDSETISDQISIYGNNISGSGSASHPDSGKAIYFKGANSNIFVYGNTIWSNLHNGIYFENVSSGSVGFNKIYSNSKSGVYLNGLKNAAVYNNTIYSNSVAGIYLSSSSSNLITGNEINGNNYGVYASDNSDLNAISDGNKFYNNAYGIYFYGGSGKPDSNLVSNSKVFGNTNFDLYSIGGGTGNSGSLVDLGNSTISSFVMFDSAIGGYSDQLTTPSGHYLLNEKVKTFNTSSNGWMLMNLYYSNSELLGAESSLKLFRYNTTSNPAELVSGVLFNTSGDYASYNTTDSAIFSLAAELPTQYSKIIIAVPLNYDLNSKTKYNVSWSSLSAITEVLIETNLTGIAQNYTATNFIGSGTYSFESVYPAGDFYIKSFAKNANGDSNSTQKNYFSVTKANNPLSLELNGVSGNITIQEGHPVNVTVFAEHGPMNILMDDNSILDKNGQPLMLEFGEHAFKAFSSSQNYSGNTTIFYVSMTRAPSNPPQQNVGGGGIGGPYKRIEFSGVPDSIESSAMKFSIKNIGTAIVKKLSIELQGIPSSWYSFSVIPDEISPQDFANVQITFALPEGESIEKTIKLIAKVEDSNLIEKDFSLKFSSPKNQVQEGGATTETNIPPTAGTTTTATNANNGNKTTNPITGAITLLSNSELGKIILQFVFAVANFLQTLFSFKPF